MKKIFTLLLMTACIGYAAEAQVMDIDWLNLRIKANTHEGATTPNTEEPVPIELSYFKATQVEATIHLEWRVETELNNDYMAIEHSTDGIRFEEIGLVMGRGTSIEPMVYNFVDEYPVDGANYYRIRQVDLDGATEYHNTVVITLEQLQNDVAVFPTFVNDQFTVSFDKATEKEAQVYVTSLNGQLVRTHTINQATELHTININNLTSGIYVVTIVDGPFVTSTKIYKN